MARRLPGDALHVSRCNVSMCRPRKLWDCKPVCSCTKVYTTVHSFRPLSRCTIRRLKLTSSQRNGFSGRVARDVDIPETSAAGMIVERRHNRRRLESRRSEASSHARGDRKTGPIKRYGGWSMFGCLHKKQMNTAAGGEGVVRRCSVQYIQCLATSARIPVPKPSRIT